ncbi:uncharacterized protein Z520_02026 [Fonsecaea multimorphosa CBS 102226]|uniref:Non-structural maintenance of chromosomes element 4 n=1 Tax=Fonsecaea multimorphosa CBS 102226 TaxID=1442371 RepID=A0A0D2K7E8_9EURO|nr:uncharacterized protein Z520_02026 [Fonsecaea multimorphosa CBS 102226]KIY01888.1 hypothetical protein Z520_02026 [Fonsecaea multimorphosa CBS 102226]OAL29573.1 hypothetical protein AYO22_01987 [Fonsecaea multimorphosa]
MARLNTQTVSSDTETERLISSPSGRTAASPAPPSALGAYGSDKENEHHTLGSNRKRKSAAANMSDKAPVDTRKRRRTEAEESQTPSGQQYYDPDQKPEERRQVRKFLRGLHAKLHDLRAEYLRPDSKGIEETLREADENFKNVKQPSEATIDSRFLVETADLSWRKINNLTLGDGTIGIDVDDFVTKCIMFMKQGNASEAAYRDAPPSTQTQAHRRRRRQDADEEDEGDTMNWEYLGKNACFLYNSRPCLTGFLLGPLSVQKKVRQQTQRKAREARTEPTQAVRPVQLGDEDLQKQESANLTEICTEIARLLQTAMITGIKNAEREVEEADQDLSEEQTREILRKSVIADNGCVPLFNFCVNPKSFGQTVENMFYVSFLIKEGKVALDFDSHGLPTLGLERPKSMEERQETQRNQAIFTLDFDIWEDIVQTFGIQKSIIPHRREEKYDDGILDYAHREDDADRREEEQEDSDAYS